MSSLYLFFFFTETILKVLHTKKVDGRTDVGEWGMDGCFKLPKLEIKYIYIYLL